MAHLTNTCRSAVYETGVALQFQLQVVDLDNDPTHPNYQLGLALDYPPVLRLAQLPLVGTLYQACNASGHYYTNSSEFYPVRKPCLYVARFKGFFGMTLNYFCMIRISSILQEPFRLWYKPSYVLWCTSLPRAPTLYSLFENKQVSSIGQVLHRCASSFEVELHYVPPKDAFSPPGGGGDPWGFGSIRAGNPSDAGTYGLSPFTSFAFYAEDGITSERSDENAEVLLFVAPCNDPPVSRNTSAAALSHTLSTVTVNATDVDDDEGFAQVLH
jgi:hypothetical protein